MDHVWGLQSYPALQDWTSSKKDGHASNAYLLIRSTDTQKTMSALRNVPEIQEIIGTTGNEDIVARISADPRANLLESVVSKVQSMPGVLSTETLPAFSQY
jgi:DNA-binding Lrp family transcriptional regulator